MTRLVRSPEPSATQWPPTGHRIVRLSPRLLIWIVSSAMLVTAASIGSILWPTSTARAAGVTKASTARSGTVSSATLGSFGWLASTAPPATWARLSVPSGLGTLSSPPGFRVVPGDPGTLSLALRDSVGTYLGYLNVTPREGPETLQDWVPFRLSHLLGDDAVSVREDTAVRSVRTAATVRSCVADDYVTTIGHHHFHEVACYVTSGSVRSVVVGTTPSGDPAHVWTQLERAVAAYPFAQGDTLHWGRLRAPIEARPEFFQAVQLGMSATGHYEWERRFLRESALSRSDPINPGRGVLDGFAHRRSGIAVSPGSAS